MATDTRHEVWRIEQGERATATFPILNTEDELFPIDGWDVEALFRTRPGGDLLYTFPLENITLNSDDNTVTLVVPAPVSELWTWTTGWGRVRITNPDTVPEDPARYRVLTLTVVIDPD